MGEKRASQSQRHAHQQGLIAEIHRHRDFDREPSPVLEAYRAKAGTTVDGYFSRLPDAADHPVFRLTESSVDQRER